MKRLGLFIVVMMFGVVHSSLANSYLTMITTPPEGYVPEEYHVQKAERLPLWYDDRIVTSAPVVASPLPKYLAWKRAKANEAHFRYVRDDMQNAINFVGGVVTARLAYDIWGPHHKHHLLGR